MEKEKRVEVKVSKDGSKTLYVPLLNEHYHSTNGAYTESMHVFIQAGLNEVKTEEVSILEFGFGTGLNAFLTMIYANHKRVYYHAMEKYPLNLDQVNQLEYSNLFEGKYKNEFLQIHTTDWEKEAEINNNFMLYKQLCDFKEVNLLQNYNLIYFDAFAPDIQPDLWTIEIFEKAFRSLLPGGILTTYCAKGVVRRMMQEVGFEVERLPGPPGKREMLRARRI